MAVLAPEFDALLDRLNAIPKQAIPVRERAAQFALDQLKNTKPTSKSAEEARSNFLPFVKHVHEGYAVNWHHEKICSGIEDWVDRWQEARLVREAGQMIKLRLKAGEAVPEIEIEALEVRKDALALRPPNLMIFVPPQHGKSELVSRKLPPWLFGRFPTSHILACSYTANLAGDMNRDVQRVMESEPYKEVFPLTRLPGAGRRAGAYKRDANQFDIVGYNGYYKCAGIGGGITGKNFNFGIIDDPIKDRKEARSPTYKAGLREWFTSVFRTRRMDDTSGVILMMTRWSDDDLAGWLANLAKTNAKADQWKVIEFPAISEPAYEIKDDPRQEAGEALWPERFGRDYLESTRATLTSFEWSSLYMQRPTPAGGTIFMSEWFRYFHYDQTADEFILEMGEIVIDPETKAVVSAKSLKRIDLSKCRMFQTIDTALTESQASNYTVVGTFAITPESELLVFDIWRYKIEVPYQYAAIHELRGGPCRWIADVKKNLPTNIWPRKLMFQAVEDKASGIGLIQQARADGRPFHILEADGDKVERSVPVAAMYSQSKVFHLHGAPWINAFENELTRFPNGKDNDQADVVAYAGLLVQNDRHLRAYLAKHAPNPSELFKAAGEGGAKDAFKFQTATGGTVEIEFDDND